MQNIVGYRNASITVTPTVSAALPYSANDQVGGIQTLTLPTGVTFASICIPSVHVIDSSKQSAALNLYFFSSLPTVPSTDNQPVNIAASEMNNKLAFYLQIAAASYITSTNVTFGTNGDNNSFRFVVPGSLSALYVVAQTTGTPTYSTTSALTFKYMIQMHY